MKRPPNERVLRMGAWFALAFLVFYLVFVGGGWGGIYAVQLRIASLLLACVVIAAWAMVAVVRPAWRPRSAIWPALAISLAAMALTTVLSRNPRISVEYLAWSVILVALYLLLQRLLADDFFRPRLMGLAVLLCGITGSVYVLVSLGEWTAWWGLVGHLAVPPLRPGFAGLVWGNPSAVMTMAVLLLASAVAHLGTGTRGRAAGVALLVGLTGVVTLLSGSRSGWLAVALASVLVIAAWLLVGANRSAARRAVGGLARRRGLRVASGAALVLGVVVAAALAPAVIFRVQAGGESLRGSYYAAAVRMGIDSPVVGSGPGMWVEQRIAYTPAGEPDYYIPHAHDIYLQTFAEHGALGVVAGAIAVGCLVWLIVRAIRSEDPDRRRYGWCTLFATAYFGAHQLLDFYPNMPAVLFAFALPVAWLDATSDRSLLPVRLSAGWRRFAGAAGIVAVAASVGVLAWAESSALALSQAVRAADASDWSAATAPARSAAAQDPAMPANQFVLGLAAAHAGDLATAEEALAASTAADDLPVAWLDLAAVQAARGDHEAARMSLDRALRLGTQQPAVAFAAGDLYASLGDRAAAQAMFVTALRAVPSLAGDPYWTATAERSAGWPALLDAALVGMAPESGFDAALSSGDPDRARAIATAISDPAMRSLALDVIDAWTGSDAAWHELERRASEHPLDPITVQWTARTAARRGDDAAAARYRRWLEIVLGGTNTGAYEVRVLRPGEGAAQPAGLNGLFYGHFTYRRPTPSAQFVPTLPMLVWR